MPTTKPRKRLQVWLDPGDATTLRRAVAREAARTGGWASLSGWVRQSLLAAARPAAECCLAIDPEVPGWFAERVAAEVERAALAAIEKRFPEVAPCEKGIV